MKNINRILTAALAAFIVLFASCSLFENESAQSRSTLVAVKVNNPQATRTILPQVTIDDIAQIAVTASQNGALVYAKTFSHAELTEADYLTLVFEVSNEMLASSFIFEMQATTLANSVFSGTLTSPVSALEPTELNFILQPKTLASGTSGKLSIDFTVANGKKFYETQAYYIEFDLYSDMEMRNKVITSRRTILEKTSDTKNILVENLEDGTYIYNARFYNSSTLNKFLVYQTSEAVQISAGLTSYSSVILPIDNTVETTFYIHSMEEFRLYEPVIKALPSTVTPQLIFSSITDGDLEEIAVALSVNPEHPDSNRFYNLNFYGCDGITDMSGLNQSSETSKLYISELTLPENLAVIESDTFRGMNYINGIVIPEAVIHIGANAFEGCYSLEVDNIHYYDFENADMWNYFSLKTREYAKIDPSKSISELIKDSPQYEYHRFIETITPANYTEIISSHGNNPKINITYEFSEINNLDELKSVNYTLAEHYPDDLETETTGKVVLDYSKCTDITDFYFLANYTYGDFDIKIKKAILPTSTTKILDDAFNGFKIDEVNFEALVNLTYIGESAFSGANLAVVNLPSSVSSIGDGCFFQNENLDFVDISNTSITELKPHTFSYCSNLTEVDLPDCLTSIGQYAFIESAQTGIGLRINLDYEDWVLADDHVTTLANMDALIDVLLDGSEALEKR
ncbi:MAG: leucine-rich repeat protein [Treponema sp.]|nr:leucine-rich repeat protein [Candidatus Treponema equifaecale]